MKRFLRLQVVLLCITAMPSSAQPYSAFETTVEGIRIVRLVDETSDTVVSIIPSVGNLAYEMKVNGKNVFWFPYDSVADFAAEPKLCGNPFLAPWANRLDEDGFFANGKHYELNSNLGNFLRDGNQLPLHGLLLYTPHWRVRSVKGGTTEARVVSRLDFSHHADLMAQFPFAHSIEISYILSAGVLEVETQITNLGAQTMPVSVGYHPYFQLHESPRDQWMVRLSAKRLWVLDDHLIPTGETRPIQDVFANPSELSLDGTFLDHVFGDLQRDDLGRAHFSVQAKQEKIEVIYGPKYQTAVVYAPSGDNKPFICFEPMSGITNAFNLAHRGVYKDLQTIPSGATWKESFCIRPSGF